MCCLALIRSEEQGVPLGKLHRHQAAVDASGLGGNCNGIYEKAILGLAATLPKYLTGVGPEFCSMLSVLTCF